MKATSIFGGVQFLTILIQIVRSKVIALLLGPSGIGIMSIVMGSLNIITSATNFGLAVSGVREVAEAEGSGNEEKIVDTVSLVKKLVWFTGFLGLVVTAILSPLLSHIAFGNYDYAIGFAILSVTLLFTQLYAGQSVLLQGLRKIKWLAKASVLGALIGMTVSLPLFYFFGVQGIVPAIVANSAGMLAVQYYFSNKLKIREKVITFREAVMKGRVMLKLGFMLSLNELISYIVLYTVKIFITKTGGLEQVGFYDIGFAIVNGYVGMVFTAMGTDYYPRLAAVHADEQKSNELINQQSEIALYILSPLICIFLMFINGIIFLLYSKNFLPAAEMIHWAILGVFFKAVSWSIGFIILAKGNTKAFFWNQVAYNSYFLCLNCAGYYLGGLEGLGVSYVIGSVLYILQMYLFSRINYGFRLSQGFTKMFFIYLILGVCCFIISYFLKGIIMYVVGIPVILMVSAFSVYNLNRKLNLLELVKSKIKNR